MKLVKATNASVAMNKKLKEFHRIVREGEEFVVSNERYAYLNGGNPFRAVFVKLVKDVDEGYTVAQEAKVETAAPAVETTVATAAEEEPEVIVIKPKKKTTKKKEA